MLTSVLSELLMQGQSCSQTHEENSRGLMSEGGSGLHSGGWRKKGEGLFTAPEQENVVFLSQTLILLPKLPGRGSWLRVTGTGSGVSPRPVCLGCWLASPGCCNLFIDVAEAIVQIKRRYLFSLQIEGLLSDQPTTGIH